MCLNLEVYARVCVGSRYVWVLGVYMCARVCMVFICVHVCLCMFGV